MPVRLRSCEEVDAYLNVTIIRCHGLEIANILFISHLAVSNDVIA